MGDSFATKDDVKQVERLLRADIGRAETSLQGKIDTVEVKLLDRIERVETTLLSEFHKYAHSSRARMLMTEVKTLTLSDRMAALELGCVSYKVRANDGVPPPHGDRFLALPA